MAKELTVNGRIPEVSSRMENEDKEQLQELAESGETETPETSERVDSIEVVDEGKTRENERRITEQTIAEFITEDNVQQIIDGIIERTNLSDLETGKIYYSITA